MKVLKEVDVVQSFVYLFCCFGLLVELSLILFSCKRFNRTVVLLWNLKI